MSSQQPRSYVCELNGEQAVALRDIVARRGWELDTVPHARWRAAQPGIKVIAYQSGKLVVQGKGTAEFVRFTLEPEILGEARFGYETELAEAQNPAMFTPHAGIDESGKGDYFGPLVVAAVHVTGEEARELLEMGVADSKTIKSDRKIMALCERIRVTVEERFSIVPIGPEAYNRLHAKLANVNRILAWGHARALENLLERVPDCPRAISDQFAHKRAVLDALMGKGREVKLEQRPKAEADVAVAAASILARADFLRRLERLGATVGVKLPKGAGPAVIAAGKRIVSAGGRHKLATVAKLHFKTTDAVM